MIRFGLVCVLMPLACTARTPEASEPRPEAAAPVSAPRGTDAPPPAEGALPAQLAPAAAGSSADLVSRTVSGTLAHAGDGTWLLTPCGAGQARLDGDPSYALTGLGPGPWQVVLAVLSGAPILTLLEVDFASPAGDACTLQLPLARGSEPGWALTWSGDPARGTFQSAGQPPVAVDQWTLGPGPCHDGAAGAYYHRSARILVGDTEFRGCAVEATVGE